MGSLVICFTCKNFYDFLCDLSQQESCYWLRLAFHDEAPSHATVYNLHCLMSLNVVALNSPMIWQKHGTKEWPISRFGQVHKILYEHLVVRKLCTRWIPHELTEVQKLRRVDWCHEINQNLKESTHILCSAHLRIWKLDPLLWSRNQKIVCSVGVSFRGIAN